MNPLTRREFFRAFIPGRRARRIFVTALVVAGGGYLAFEVAEVVRTQGLMASARTLGFMVGAGLVFFLLSKLIFEISQAIGRASEDFRRFAANLSRVLNLATAMALGAWLYERWSRGVDITPTLVVLALAFGIFLFLNDKADE